MPLIPITRKVKGKTQRGYKWGESGARYFGLGAKAKALAQGKAIEASKQQMKNTKRK